MAQNKEFVTVIWEEFLKIMKEEAGSQVVATWFRSVTLMAWDALHHHVTLQTPNQFVSQWIQQHYTTLLQTHLGRLLHSQKLRIFFSCDQQHTKHKQTSLVATSIVPAVIDPETKKGLISIEPARTTKSPLLLENKPKPTKNVSSNLNKLYTFDTFIVGPSNSLAHAAANAVCKNLGKVYNPLFIYGGTGLGKTHLLHAIGNYVLQHDPKKTVRYETSDRFINEFISSIRFDRSQQFREKYQNIDLLLIDDIQFLSNKEQTQEIFFHIFNNLYEQNKQIVLSSDTFPQEIKGLQNRVQSRMEWGLIADIQIPDLETKIVILKQKASLHNIILDDDVADFIASRVTSNVRELEGALVRVSAFAALINKPISLEMARKILVNLTPKKKKDSINFDHIIKIIAKQFELSVNDIKSKKRQQDISCARQVTFYLMKKLTSHSLQTIAHYIGKRDHSTAIHAISKIEERITTDKNFENKIKLIENKILTIS